VDHTGCYMDHTGCHQLAFLIILPTRVGTFHTRYFAGKTPFDDSRYGPRNQSSDTREWRGNPKRRPARLAYDRPSHKFISFLAKKYNLKNYTPQNNNYVVFRDYWEGPRRGMSAKRVGKDEENARRKVGAYHLFKPHLSC
jgi:hypothetical protein